MARRNNPIVLAAILAVGLVGCNDRTFTVHRADLAAGGHYVVLPLADAPGDQAKGSGNVIAGDLVAELVRLPEVRVFRLSDAKLTAALESSGFDRADLYDPIVAADVGQQAKADCVLFGELMHYGPERSRSDSAFSIFRGGKTTTVYWVSLNVRIIRAADGKILYAGYGVAADPEGYQKASRDACHEALQGLRDSLGVKD